MIRNNTIFSIAIILFLSSCSGELLIMKRRYTKGYYISISKHNSRESVAKAAVVMQTGKLKKEDANSIESQGIYSQQRIEEAALPGVPEVKTSLTNMNKEDYVLQASSTRKMATKSSVNLKSLSETKSFYQPVDRDNCGKGILLSILAFIIPPLAIYLENLEINIWFWITLVLFLLFLIFVFLPFSDLIYILTALFCITSQIVALIYVMPECVADFFSWIM